MRKKIAVIMTSDFNFDQRMLRIHTILSTCDSVDIIHRGQGHHAVHTIFRKGVLFYIEFNFRLFFYLISKNFDVVYSVDTDTLCGSGMATFFKKFHLIYDSHEYFIGVPELENSVLKKYVWKVCERLFVKKSRLCITVGDVLASILSREFGNAFHAIKNVPFKSTYQRNENVSKPYFIYQGALNEGRGLEELIEVMKHYEKYELKIAGSGDIEQILFEKVKSQNIQNVTFLGKVSPLELLKYTESALIGFNLLSKKSQSYYFSSANKTYDYINSLVPSVNMHFPEYVYLLNKYQVGITIMELDVKSLTFAIDHLLNETIRLKMIDQCKLAREVLNWEIEGAKLKQLLVEHKII